MALITGANPQHHEHMGSAKYHKIRDGVAISAALDKAVVSKKGQSQELDGSGGF